MTNKEAMPTKVKFKKDYDGCFKEFKGKVLTVQREYDCPENDSKLFYVIEEILEVDQYHLIKSRNFEIIERD